MDKNVVYYVTGATGWVGHTLVKKLLQQKERIIIFVLPSDRLLSLYDDLKDRLLIVFGDITKKEDCERFLASGEKDVRKRVIHCAGIVSVSGRFSQIVYDVNVTGTKNLADAALAGGIDRFVYVSTSHALKERPKSEIMTESFAYEDDPKRGNYAVTKAEATKYVIDMAKKGLQTVVIHPTAVIGPDDPMKGYMTSMFYAFLCGKLPGSVNGAYDLIDVRDLADLLISASEKGKSGNNYIASGHRLMITELINTIARLTGRKKIKVTLPFWFVKAVAPVYECHCRVHHKKALYTKYSMIAMGSNSRFSNAKARKELGLAPRPIEESIKDTAAWLIERYPECTPVKKAKKKDKKEQVTSSRAS